jgi:hypothetical protein
MELQDWLELVAIRLRSIPKLTVTTDPNATPIVGLATIDQGEIGYDQSMLQGGTITNIEVVVYVSKSDSKQGHREARRYLSGYGERSVRQALVTPVDDDALANRVHVETGQAEQIGASDGTGYIAVRFAVRFQTPGPNL